MPTVHIANLLVSLETGSTAWSIPVQPGTDSRWSTQTPNYSWDFTLTEAQGRDLVEFRLPDKIVDPTYGEFALTATSTVAGQSSVSFSASGSYLCSAQFSSGAQVYVEVEATPTDEELPLTVPLSATPRGGGHLNVKTAGGGDPDGRRR